MKDLIQYVEKEEALDSLLASVLGALKLLLSATRVLFLFIIPC